MISAKAIMDSARGEQCTVRYPGVCNGNPETVIFAHSNALGAGKGVGHKSFILCGAYACQKCHDVYDARTPRPAHWTRNEVQLWFYQGHERTLVRLHEKGLL